MSQLVDRIHAAARVRAALAFAGLDQASAAERSGIPLATLRRIVATAPRGASIEELWAIADACGVPRWFMERGFAPPSAEEVAGEVQEDVVILKAQMETVLQVLSTSVAASLGGAETQRRGRAGSEGA